MGEYEIQIFDSDGCSFIERFTVDGCDLIVTEGFTVAPDCADPNTAQTTVDIDGGQMPYDIAWEQWRCNSNDHYGAPRHL